MTTRRFNRFADWCRYKDDLSPEARCTVEALLELAGTSDGDEAERILSSSTLFRLDLRNLTSDITPLLALTQLTRLNLHGNYRISDITPLSELTNLTWLCLSENQRSDITPLSSLTKLEELHLDDNQISDLTLLSGLTNLRILKLDKNQISDITPLSGLTELDELNLHSNQISDLTPLSGLTNLTVLKLYDNQISDITSLSNLTNLTDLELNNNRISDLTPLSNLTSLGCLELNNNQISDIKPLSTLTQLTRLPLENNQISDLTPLSNLTSLGCLELNNNQIRDIMPLSNLTNLTDLELNNNQISDLTPLSALTQLEFLELNNNQISDLTPLSGLTNLCDLNLDNNPIPNLNLLKALQQQWRNLSTEPITPQPATAAVHSAYATIGLVEPEIIFCTSPYAALVLLSGCESLGVPLAKILSENSSKPLSPGLWHWLRQQMEFQLGEEVETQLYQQLKDDGIEMKSYNNYRMTQGNYIIPEALVELISITEFCISEFGCVLDHKEQEALRCLKQLFLSCGWIFPYEKVCVVCDRPRILCFDNQERLHAEASPAIQYADGWSVYAYHGLRLPEKYGKVHPNQWQSQWLVSEENAELRRVLIQEIGYARLVEELQAIELDSWQEYTLIGIDFNADEEPIYLLKMTCPSTGYIHALRVPPDMKSAREAISWVNWGVDPEQFSVQT